MPLKAYGGGLRPSASNKPKTMIMNRHKWTLFVCTGRRIEQGTDRNARDLAAAEEIAKDLFRDWDIGDPQMKVFCVPHVEGNTDYAEHHPTEDFPVWDGKYWQVMRSDWLGPAHLESDDEFIKNIKDEESKHKTRHLTELSMDELKDLFCHISPGSVYLSDYANDYGVDEEEVSDWVEDFEADLACQIKKEFPTITDHDLEDAVEARENAQEFANFVYTIPF